MPNRSRRFDKQDIPRKPGLIEAERLARAMFVQCLDTLACLTLLHSSSIPDQHIPKFVKGFRIPVKTRKAQTQLLLLFPFPLLYIDVLNL
jgi:hypothetical protein